MKPEKIITALNDIDGQFLMEARENAAAPRRSKRRIVVLIAAIISLMAVTVTAFASEQISSWFRQYFSRNAENGLTPGQIEFIEENEQVIAETQTHDGWSLELKSVMSDSNAVYAIVGITAPADITEEELRSLWPDMDFYDKDRKPVGSWATEQRPPPTRPPPGR